MFCYVNSVFAPGLDEGVGGLWKVCTQRTAKGRVVRGVMLMGMQCFKTKDELVVAYSTTPAFG